jgi:general secretion pathway protein I
VTRRSSGGFTLVEVLVALVVVALGLSALMVAVQGAARTSGYLRDKTLGQWIALNRIAEVRLTVNKGGQAGQAAQSGQSGQSNDTGQLDFANRTWHYDTRYFDTTYPSMKRVVVRVWAGDAKTKSNPIAESTSFLGTSLSQPGVSNVDWTVGSTAASQPCAAQGATPALRSIQGANAPTGGTGTNCPPAQGIAPVAPTTPLPITTTGPGTQE